MTGACARSRRARLLVRQHGTIGAGDRLNAQAATSNSVSASHGATPYVLSATTLRQWHVLTMLPRSPRRIDTGAIESRLRERGIEVHRRTIQRDLIELAEVFPIVADERARPYGWRWSEDAEPAFDVPAPHRSVTGTRTDEVNKSGIDISLRVRRTALELVAGRLGARGARVSGDAKDPLFVIVAAAVDDSSLTRRLLLGHGDEVEVLAPLALRNEIAERARRVFAAHAR